MSWHDRMNRAIDYIESNLTHKIDMKQAAQCSNQSEEAFIRTFSAVADMPVSEYVRKRRLSLALYEIQNSDEKVINISSKYGYESPDAFARAFKEQFGLPPTSARDASTPLKPFPRISFYMSIKGDVKMDAYEMDSDVQIINMYYENMPAFRFIGRRYTSLDVDPVGGELGLEHVWSEWFQNGWFHLLFNTGAVLGHEFEALFMYERKATDSWPVLAWWIGVPTPAGTEVPEGFIYKDFEAGILGTSWVCGSRQTLELATEVTHTKAIDKILSEGNTISVADDMYVWSFQRYDSKRFFTPDNDGKVILDHCVFLMESEAIKQAMEEREKAVLFIAAETLPDISSTPSPEVKLEGMAPFAGYAQNNMLLSALTTMLLKLENISESTPYFCSNIGSICNGCSGCRDKSNLYKHHSKLYHFLITITGIAFMNFDRNHNSTYDLKVIPGILPPQLEDRLDFVMKSRGFAYTCPGKNMGEREVFRRIKESILQGKPVLIKFGIGPVWGLVTGYNEGTGTIYGLDMRSHGKDDKGAFAEGNMSYTQDGLFALKNWFRYIEKVVIVTGRTEKFGFENYVERIIAQLEAPNDGTMSIIPRLIESATYENAYGIAAFILNASYSIMDRWHGSDGFEMLSRETNNSAIHDILQQCDNHCVAIHDIVWQLWKDLGIGPHTDGKLPKRIGNIMTDKVCQEALKELIINIRDNDMAILRLLKGVYNQ